jgi:hypothetical protein
MRNIYLVTLFLLSSFYSYSQNKIEIGKVAGNSYIITADTTVLRKALQRTLGDGTQIFTLHIESTNAYHYLVGTGIYKGHSKLIAAQLQYDIVTRSFFAVPLLPYVSCSSAACDNCHPFKENGKIIGCKCEEKSTVSNQCNFASVAQSSFYDNVKRYEEMKPRNP